MIFEDENYEVYQENPVRIIVDEKNQPWFCGVDIAKILGYKAPNIAIQDNCKSKKVIPFYPKNLGKMKRLSFINEEDALNLIKKKVFKANDFIVYILNGKLPEIKTGYSNAKFAVIDLEKEEQIITNDGNQYKINVQKV